MHLRDLPMLVFTGSLLLASYVAAAALCLAVSPVLAIAWLYDKLKEG